MLVTTDHPTVAEVHPPFLSKAEVLRLLPICATTLWQWTRTQRFPAPRVIGSKTVWIASDVFRWMETRPPRQYKRVKGV